MKIFLNIILLFISFGAKADMFRSTLFTLNTIYLDRDYNNNGVLSQSKITDTDLRLMRIEKYWSYGVIYSLSSNDASDSSLTSIGLSGGYYSEKDFFLNLHYFPTSKYSFNGNSEYNSCSGYEFDVGFLSKVTSSFYVGLLIALKNFNYSQQNVGGVNSSVSVTHKEVIPMFSFGINLM